MGRIIDRMRRRIEDLQEREFNSVENYTGCPCRACISDHFSEAAARFYFSTRLIVCKKCGNKRCPHATDHQHECTESNKPGQPGSVY